MIYNINSKTVKQSIKNMSSYIKSKGYEVPLNVIQESFSKSLFFKDWNTLSGIQKSADTIKHCKRNKNIILEIHFENEIDFCLKSFIQQKLVEANCSLKISEFIQSGNNYQIKFLNCDNSNNLLTFIIQAKSDFSNQKIKRFEIMRETVEKEDFSSFFKPN